MFAARVPLRTVLALLVMSACGLLIVAERSGRVPQLAQPVTWLLEWSVLLGAVALLIGVLNVLWIHLRRIQRGQSGWGGSLMLVVMMVAVMVAGFASSAAERGPLVEWTFDALIAPGAATLFALIAVFLLAMIFHQVRVGRPGGAWVMAGLLLMLAMQTPAARSLVSPEVEAWSRWIVEAPVSATLRGALLGTGLALVIVGLRWATRRLP
ncbi:MAG: hypothetical protein ACRC1H_13445 [Caldilineaceae bacterium]